MGRCWAGTFIVSLVVSDETMTGQTGRIVSTPTAPPEEGLVGTLAAGMFSGCVRATLAVMPAAAQLRLRWGDS